jgi:hypothetical protein
MTHSSRGGGRLHIGALSGLSREMQLLLNALEAEQENRCRSW